MVGVDGSSPFTPTTYKPLEIRISRVFNLNQMITLNQRKFTHAQTQYHLQNFKSLPLDIIKNCLAECSDDLSELTHHLTATP